MDNTMTDLIIAALVFVAGLSLLLGGAEVLVRSASSLGKRFGFSPLVIGLTIVAFSTSAPEIVISVQAALTDRGDIALGNVFGSNLANIGLILGVTALLRPLGVQQRSVRLDAPIMLLTMALSGGLLLDGIIGRWEGGFLVLLMAGLIVLRIALENRDPSGDIADVPAALWPLKYAAMGILSGILLLTTGGALLIRGSVDLATLFGVPEAVIAISVVAIGTSLPELSTSVLAALRGNADMAIGNVLGSNIFNACAVLGLAALAKPISGDTFMLEVLATLVLGFLLLPMLRSGFRIERWEGALLLILYTIALVSSFLIHTPF